MVERIWLASVHSPDASKRVSVADSRTLFLPLVDVFGDEEILELFSEDALVEAWLEVERALALAQSELGIVPLEADAAIAAEATGDKVDLGR